MASSNELAEICAGLINDASNGIPLMFETFPLDIVFERKFKVKGGPALLDDIDVCFSSGSCEVSLDDDDDMRSSLLTHAPRLLRGLF